jgi:pantothenate kinase type III
MLNNSTNLIDTKLGKNSFPSLNTTDAVSTGIFTSIQGSVNLVCKQFSSSLPILLTGGDAHLIYEQAEEDWKSRAKLENDLLFDGLEIYI